MAATVVSVGAVDLTANTPLSNLRRRSKDRRRRAIRRRLRAAFILVVGLFLALPLFYLIAASLMTQSQLDSYPPKIIPSGLNWDNYARALSYLSPRTIANSFIFTASVVAFQWALTVSGGFVVAKMRIRGKNLITAVYAVTLFVPFISVLVPTFILVYKLHLVETYVGLILPVVAQTNFGTLLFRQYIGNLPDELIDAARVDGANWWKIFVSVVIPLAKPATGAYVAISTLTAWNMYLWPLIVTSGPDHQVLPLALAPLASGTYSTVPEPVALAATLLTTLPMIVAFLVAQRAFVRGLTGTGIE